ncbi:universal stress protein A [Nitratireductor aestuarii]|uniref:Universal stress protein A n=1 Tax=Nitratireductor aestuarii TaxID=1735103 RepID=A0A916RZ34_9HYPH|nr:universal stress protein [Nitratireductor aestuarii]GGA76341.1 universal stress protein A [Nitratireductor aestuarii]
MTRLQCLLVGSPANEPFAQTPALSFGNELARAASARLTVCVLPPLASLALFRRGNELVSAVRTEIERVKEITRLAAFEAQKLIGNRGSASPSLSDTPMSETQSARLIRLSRVNDLAVLDAAHCVECPQREIIEEVLFESGRPLIIVPETGGNPTPKRIAIAWDGSAHCSRAIHDALPFLRAASEVSIVTVAGEKDLSSMTPGADLANYLLLKDVPEIRVEMLSAPDRNIADRLNRYVQESGVELLVMGASMQSRYRNAILGSVTGAILDRPPTTLFMAH